MMFCARHTSRKCVKILTTVSMDRNYGEMQALVMCHRHTLGHKVWQCDSNPFGYASHMEISEKIIGEIYRDEWDRTLMNRIYEYERLDMAATG